MLEKFREQCIASPQEEAYIRPKLLCAEELYRKRSENR
jgi:hypothetical protein